MVPKCKESKRAEMHYNFDEITISYNPKIKKEIVGITTSGDCQFGKYFAAIVRSKEFEFEILNVQWEDGSVDIYPRLIRGDEKMQTLHGRLRISVKPIVYRGVGYYTATLKQARLKKGLSLHSNLFSANLDQLEDGCGYNINQTLENFGAINFGTKEDILADEGIKRFEYCVIFRKSNYDIPIIVFILTRILPLQNDIYA
jgi:hypothetical protein